LRWMCNLEAVRGGSKGGHQPEDGGENLAKKGGGGPDISFNSFAVGGWNSDWNGGIMAKKKIMKTAQPRGRGKGKKAGRGHLVRLQKLMAPGFC